MASRTSVQDRLNTYVSKVVTVSQASEIMGFGNRRVQELAKLGRIASVMLPRRILILDREEVESKRKKK